MSWTHPDIPRRFRHVHREWHALSGTERRALKERLTRYRDAATLALFEEWEDWYTRQTSPWRWRLEVAR